MPDADDLERVYVALPNGSVVDAVRGYRAWRVDDDLARLRSTAAGSTWEPREPLVASGCSCPGPCRGCGIYAWRHPRYLGVDLDTPESEIHHRSLLRHRYVYGEVNLWGNVIVAEYGLRATHAMPSTLYTSRCSRCQAAVELVATAYDLPMVNPTSEGR